MTRFFRPISWSSGSISTASASRRRASILPSSRTSMATTSATCRCRPARALPRLPAPCRRRPGAAGAESMTRMRAKLLKAMPGLKERAKTLVELQNGAALSVRHATTGHGRQGKANHRRWRQGASDTALVPVLGSGRCTGGPGARGCRQGPCRGHGHSSSASWPSPSRGLDRHHHVARHF